MELPPGWRGYGAKDYVDHPDTPKRAAEVEALKQKMAGAPRFAVQEALDALRARCCPSRCAAATSASTNPSRGRRGHERRRVINDAISPRAQRQRARTAATPLHRKLTISVLRYNPQEPSRPPRMQTYELEEADGMTLFIALNEIREKQDPSLQFDFVCRAGICGSCAMVINGRPTLACRTLTKNLGPEITLAPLPFFELIGDLSVDTGKWMRGMSERLRGLAAHEGSGSGPAPDRGADGSGSRATGSTSSTAASSAAAAWPPAAPRGCARISSARSG